MPNEINWIRPGRILYVRLYGNILPVEISEQAEQIQARLAEGLPPVHMVINGGDVEQISLSLQQARMIYPPMHPKLGWTVFYGTHRLRRYFASTMLQLEKTNYHFFDSREEAMTFLTRIDCTLQEPENLSAAAHV